MYDRPFVDQVQGPRRKVAFEDRLRTDFNRLLKLAVPRAETRGGVVIEKHSNQYSVERADGWHCAMPILTFLPRWTDWLPRLEYDVGYPLPPILTNAEVGALLPADLPNRERVASAGSRHLQLLAEVNEVMNLT